MLPFVCPRCRVSIARSAEVYECAACKARYPIVAGIPDFRVAPDPWIGLEQDREKALRLERMTAGLDFETAVRAYWSITPETPRELAGRFIEHVLEAEERSGEWLRLLNDENRQPREGPWLDLGCGTADLALSAAGGGVLVVAADIALRWLVVARRRSSFEASGVRLVCCCAERLPFPAASFGRVLSLGLLEHCRDSHEVLAETERVLKDGGTVRLRTVNRYTILREPHVRVWGVGLLPRRWADRYVQWRSTQRYLHHQPLSRRELRHAMRDAGFEKVRVSGAALLGTERARLGRLGRGLASVYSALRETPLLGNTLAWVGPLLEGQGRRP